jgi:hypothetical protein
MLIDSKFKQFFLYKFHYFELKNTSALSFTNSSLFMLIVFLECFYISYSLFIKANSLISYNWQFGLELLCFIANILINLMFKQKNIFLYISFFIFLYSLIR